MGSNCRRASGRRTPRHSSSVLPDEHCTLPGQSASSHLSGVFSGVLCLPQIALPWILSSSFKFVVNDYEEGPSSGTCKLRPSDALGWESILRSSELNRQAFTRRIRKKLYSRIKRKFRALSSSKTVFEGNYWKELSKMFLSVEFDCVTAHYLGII